jgi:hypothetical protein
VGSWESRRVAPALLCLDDDEAGILAGDIFSNQPWVFMDNNRDLGLGPIVFFVIEGNEVLGEFLIFEKPCRVR